MTLRASDIGIFLVSVGGPPPTPPSRPPLPIAPSFFIKSAMAWGFRLLESVPKARTAPAPRDGGGGDAGDGVNGVAPPAAPSYHRGDDPSGVGGIAITASCASRIRQLASSRPNPDAVYLRLYVDAGGCSGFQYKFLLLSEEEGGGGDSSDGDGGGVEDGTIDPEEDVVFARDGMRVVVDQTSLDLLRGSTIDYVSEMIRSSFAVVGNPQSESACGCGSSFAVKNFESNPAMD